MYPTQPTLIKQPRVCVMLGMSLSGLTKLRHRDPSFPKPIKNGESRQAAVYYVLTEVEAYIAGKMAARNREARA